MQVPEPLVRFAPPVARALGRHPDLIPAVVARERPGRDELMARVGQSVRRADGDDAVMKTELRRLKYAVVGALILDDLEQGPPAVDAVGAVLADLADALVEGALGHGRRTWAVPEWPDGGGFVVFAMGKHGGRELNYSSDIDLIYVARTLSGEARGSADRIGRGVGRLLSDVTADGFCFRVDLNLRPEGRAGPLVVSLAAAEHHYLTFGRTWERAAWLKARAAAGDEALGAELLSMIEPFRFRRHLDFGTLEDLAGMRDRIAASARLETLQRDLKRGPGGIREIEFLVQATQLAWVGRDPELRVLSTVGATHALASRGVLPEGVDPSQLLDDYRFLRAVEHRIQWEAEAQTQQLPLEEDESAWQRLAESLVRPSGPALRDEIADVRARVEAAWGAVFTPEETEGPLTIVDPFATVDERTAQLRGLGFEDPELAAQRLRRLAEPSAQHRMRPSTWRRFERVAPRLATLAATSGNPDEALSRIGRFVERVGARGTMYELLHENPGAMETLVRLFADSPFLSERFLQHPELLDALVLRGRGGERGAGARGDILRDLERELALRPEDGEGLLVLRTRQTVELLRIGLRDLSGADAIPCAHLVALAEALVAGAEQLATTAMRARHGVLRDASGEEVPRAIVGLGSFGSGWMTYGSDLDLVFVSRSHGESDGRRALDGRTYGARHVQRVITALTAPTREGRCYEVDIRLRPGGQGGPLCTSLHGLREWYAQRAAPWERLMLARSRVVWASNPDFREEVEGALLVARRPTKDQRLAEEARTMRRRQLAELSAERPRVLDLKLGPGGLTDIEFAVACRQLRGTDEVASQADPLAAIALLDDVQPGDGVTLTNHYGFLRRVESSLRLRAGTGAAHLDLDHPDTRRLASALGFESAEALGDEVARRRVEVARVTESWLASAP
ncbi:MAG: bifunctional [glutamate--ammonia ligase]-adenylyl-L-tyrosine phosphorylase/[glutamate--ammonia-ligase] adenylyltransferase [Deltaproteobacteria bacterium]|nr:bifunctional [glutamate--ammonia ligase]-adenylyl-L-tyrosine phosphorylase/[glutamate--ammonia-ligase] adenylyltransferase [Deltaproteobacteria bacterium]